MTERENVLMSGYRRPKEPAIIRAVVWVVGAILGAVEWIVDATLGAVERIEHKEGVTGAVMRLIFLVLVMTNTAALLAVIFFVLFHWASPVLFFPLYLFGLI